MPAFKPLFSLPVGRCMQKQVFGCCFWEPESVNQGIFSYLPFPVFLFPLHPIQSCHHFSHCSFWGWIPAVKWNSLGFICWRKGNLICNALSTLQCLCIWTLLGESGLTLFPFKNAHKEWGEVGKALAVPPQAWLCAPFLTWTSPSAHHLEVITEAWGWKKPSYSGLEGSEGNCVESGKKPSSFLSFLKRFLNINFYVIWSINLHNRRCPCAHLWCWRNPNLQ